MPVSPIYTVWLDSQTVTELMLRESFEPIQFHAEKCQNLFIALVVLSSTSNTITIAPLPGNLFFRLTPP